MKLKQMMPPLLLALSLAACASGPPLSAQTKSALAALLDGWHRAAAEADGSTYFGALAEDAVFMGTDPTERWTKAEFHRLYGKHFERGKAWTFRATERHLELSRDGRVAWFDEALHTEKMGPCRGSGVLVRGPRGWKIVHYNLSVPIPNDLLRGFVAAMARARRP